MSDPDFVYVSSNQGDFAYLNEEEGHLMATCDPTETTIFKIDDQDKAEAVCGFLNDSHPAEWTTIVIVTPPKLMN